MTRRLSILIAVLVLVAVLYVVVLRVAPPPDRKKPQKPPATAATGGVEFEKPGPYPTEYDEITVSIEIPPLSEFPEPWAKTSGCPHTRLTGVLRAAVGPGNGCPVLEVEPDGPADKAGMRRFDRLGKPEDCASGIYRSFRPTREARTVEWTVIRPKGGSAEGAGAEGAERGEPQMDTDGRG